MKCRNCIFGIASPNLRSIVHCTFPTQLPYNLRLCTWALRGVSEGDGGDGEASMMVDEEEEEQQGLEPGPDTSGATGDIDNETPDVVFIPQFHQYFSHFWS